MKNKLVAALCATLSITTLAGICAAQEKAIYGADNRAELYATTTDRKLLADSVVSLWNTSYITETSTANTITFKTMPLGKMKNLCPGEKFAEQPTGAFCSGSLVADDIVMTAGHCVKDEARCASTRLVFGFAVKAEGAAATGEFPASEVYSCTEIIKQALVSEPGPANGLDFALIRLDRKVTGHKPLAVNRGAPASAGTALFVIGHPSGMPLKIAGAAKIRVNNPAQPFFTADLDTFAGNSGSAVFNTNTGLIEGILVRGDTDYTLSANNCNVATVFPQEAGKGEFVTKISQLRDFLPQPSAAVARPGNRTAPVGQAEAGRLRELTAGSIKFN